MKPKSKQKSHLMYTIHSLYTQSTSTHFPVQLLPHEVKLRIPFVALCLCSQSFGYCSSDFRHCSQNLKIDQVSFASIFLCTLLLCFLTGMVFEVLNPGVEQFINILLLKHFMVCLQYLFNSPMKPSN